MLERLQNPFWINTVKINSLKKHNVFLLEDVYNEKYEQVQFLQAATLLPQTDGQILFGLNVPLVQPRQKHFLRNMMQQKYYHFLVLCVD